MSKTRRANVRRGFRETRQGFVCTKKKYSFLDLSRILSKLAKPENDGTRSVTFGAPTGQRRIKQIVEAAQKFLKERDLSFTLFVDYDPATMALLSPHEAIKRKERFFENKRKGPPWGSITLDGYFEKLGFGRLDDERILARVLWHASFILEQNHSRDEIIEHTFRLANELTRLEAILMADKRVGKAAGSHKSKEWVTTITKEAVAANPNYSAERLWKKIPESPVSRKLKLGYKKLEIYRDGNRVFCVDLSSDQSQSVSKRTWRRYIRAAKKS